MDELLEEVLPSGGPTEVRKLQNPITRTVVTISPPFVYTDPDQFQQFAHYFTLWCEALWLVGLMDPSEFSADQGWVASDVPGMRWVPADGDTPGHHEV